MSSLVPCPSCQRHVRSSEPACPFCASGLPTNLASRAVPGAPRRLERLAAFTFAASLAVVGCTVGGAEEGETEQQEDELGGIQPMYGMPPDDGLDAGVPKRKPGKRKPGKPDAGKDGRLKPVKDAGGYFPMYGMPAYEAAQEADGADNLEE